MKLHELEKQIRKDIPRLMELRKGCKLVSNDLSDLDLIKIVSSQDDCFYVVGKFGNVEKYKKDYLEEYYRIIGHEIMLNDVLEWLDDNKKDYGFNGEGYFYREKYSEGLPGKELYNFVQWDLSKPYLKDQSEKLINFLYNFLK